MGRAIVQTIPCSAAFSWHSLSQATGRPRHASHSLHLGSSDVRPWPLGGIPFSPVFLLTLVLCIVDVVPATECGWTGLVVGVNILDLRSHGSVLLVTSNTAIYSPPCQTSLRRTNLLPRPLNHHPLLRPAPTICLPFQCAARDVWAVSGHFLPPRYSALTASGFLL